MALADGSGVFGDIH